MKRIKNTLETVPAWKYILHLVIYLSPQGRAALEVLITSSIGIQWNPDFSNPRFPEPPDISNQTLFPLDLLQSSSIISPQISQTLDFLKLPITRTCENFMPLNKLTLPDKLLSRICITQQASHKSVISLKGKKLKFEHLLIIKQYPAN